MEESFEIETEISAGKKNLTVIHENDAYTLIESGSIVAIIEQKEGIWSFSRGSYNEKDAEIIGRLIEQNL